jgi:hypothetical protein
LPEPCEVIGEAEKPAVEGAAEVGCGGAEDEAGVVQGQCSVRLSDQAAV